MSDLIFALKDIKAQRDRIFMEAYLTHRGIARRAATALGVPKSTYHDWLKRNEELIKAEIAKTQGSL